jgi:hypothetical protein
MTISQAKSRAFAMPFLAAQSVADLTLGLGKVVYIHRQS